MRSKAFLRTALAASCIFLLMGAAIAQHQFQYRQHLTRATGLPSDEITVITQDDEGFIWIGTRSGLAKYDGAQIRVFHNDLDDSTSLVDDWVSDIEPVGDDLWIGTTRGISVLNLTTETFRNYYLGPDGSKKTSHDQSAGGASLIYRDRLGTIWIAGREDHNFGWCRHEAAADTFSCFQANPRSLSASVLSPTRVNNVLCLHLDNTTDSILWVGTISGLLRFNTVTGAMRHYYFPTEPRSFEAEYNVFRRMWQGPDGMLYCGSWSGGLNIFDPQTETYYPAPYSNTGMPDAFFQSIREISRKSESEIWVTLFKSLIAYDFVKQQITLRMESDFASDEIYGADLVDRDGRIWSRIHGVHIFDPALQRFVYASYQHLNPGGEGFTYGIVNDTVRQRLTVISRDCDALYHYYPAQNLWQKTLIPPDVIAVRRFEGNNGVILDNGEMIISAHRSIFKYIPHQDRIAPLKMHFPVTLNAFKDVHKDHHGHLWIGTDNDGVLRWDPATADVVKILPEPGRGAPVGGAAVQFVDSRNNIWITRQPDLFVYRRATRQILNLCEIDSAYCDVDEVDEDGLGKMWLRKGDTWILIADGTNPEGGIDTTLMVGNRQSPLYDLHTDEKGHVWGFFRNQIVRFDPAAYTRQSFSTEYFKDFHEISSTYLINGHELVLGLANGIILIDLENLRPNMEQPVPYISQLEVREKPYVTDVVPRRLESLTLAHNENFFSISFSALGFTLSNQNKFEYRLRNFQETWTEAADRRFANYTNVPSGQYFFELRAFNSEGELSPHSVSLPVSIRRHWTEMKRYWALVLFLFLALVYALYKYRIGQIRKEEKLKSEYKSKLADMEMTALRAQMNPHFIFNCLNSIESFMIKNDSIKASLYLNDFARLIRLILQNSGSKSIPLKDELEALELYLKMESLRFGDHFNYHIDVGDHIDTSIVQIPPLILQPYVENAIWHGLIPKEEVGHLTITIKRKNGMLHCAIEDDGIGRKKAAERNHAEGLRKSRSMGMTITKNRIELLNAMYHTNTQIDIIDLADDDGNAAGTRVELSIPV